MQRRLDSSPHTIRPKRVFFIHDEVTATYLDIAVAAGHVIELTSPCAAGVLAVTDGGPNAEQLRHQANRADGQAPS
jgi:hypothetical protein